MARQVQTSSHPSTEHSLSPAVGISVPEAMAMGRPVRLVLDASLLLEPSATGEVAAALRPGAEVLLRRLGYSNLTVV